jgi:hypothetical protein
LVAHAKCHNKSNEFAFRLIVGFIQKFQSRLQQNLIDLSLSNAFSIAKLNSINTAISCNTFTSLVCEPVTSTKQIKRDKSTPTFQLAVASVSNNNASPSMTSLHLHFSWLLQLSIGNQMPFQIMDPTNTSQAVLPYWQRVPSVSTHTSQAVHRRKSFQLPSHLMKQILSTESLR